MNINYKSVLEIDISSAREYNECWFKTMVSDRLLNYWRVEMGLMCFNFTLDA